MFRSVKKIWQRWEMLVGLVVLVFLIISLAELVSKRQNTQKSIQALQSEIEDIEKKNSELIDLVEFVESETFLESEARGKFNLAKPGEHLVIVKDSLGKENKESGVFSGDNRMKKKNPYKWFEYFFRSQSL